MPRNSAPTSSLERRSLTRKLEEKSIENNNNNNTRNGHTPKVDSVQSNAEQEQLTGGRRPLGDEQNPTEDSGRADLKRSNSNAGVAVVDGDHYVKRIRAVASGPTAGVHPSFKQNTQDAHVREGPLAAKLNEPTYTAVKSFKDPWCDPDNPKVLQFQDISAAAYKIRDGIVHTPCKRSNLLSQMMEMEIFLKTEILQVTGSFKERGARYTLSMLSPEQQKLGVIAASAGNHALALAYHGQTMNIPVTVVMPLVAPLMKITSCRQYGATVLVMGEDIGVAKEIAMKMGAEKGMTYVNGYDHPHILAGQGTMGLEIVEQVQSVDAVIIPIGGGGLIAGSALAIKYLCPTVQIIGVEASKCPSFQTALTNGRPSYTKPGSTIADGLSVPVVGGNSLATVQAHKLIDKMVVVEEEWLALAILRLIEIEKVVVEGAGAIGLAAVLGGYLPELKGKRVVIPLTGGNIDTTILGRSIERGLAEDGRLIRFVVVVSDRPGGIAEMASLLAKSGASIKDIYHERAWLKNDIFNVRVKVIAECRDKDHAVEVENALHAHYSEVIFNPII